MGVWDQLITGKSVTIAGVPKRKKVLFSRMPHITK